MRVPGARSGGEGVTPTRSWVAGAKHVSKGASTGLPSNNGWLVVDPFRCRHHSRAVQGWDRSAAILGSAHLNEV